MHLVDHRVDVRAVPCVHGVADDRGAGMIGSDRIGDLARASLVHVGDDDRRAGGGEVSCGRLSETHAGRAGDQHDSPAESRVHGQHRTETSPVTSDRRPQQRARDIVTRNTLPDAEAGGAGGAAA